MGSGATAAQAAIAVPDDYHWEPLQYARPESPESLNASAAFLHLLSSRRSVRQFSSEPVPYDLVRNAVATAATAPWGAPVQPWTFVVVGDGAIRRRVRRTLGEIVDAPYLVAVFARTSALEGALGRHRAPEAAPSVGLASGMLVVRCISQVWPRWSSFALTTQSSLSLACPPRTSVEPGVAMRFVMPRGW
jgi:Nitroreductase family